MEVFKLSYFLFFFLFRVYHHFLFHTYTHAEVCTVVRVLRRGTCQPSPFYVGHPLFTFPFVLSPRSSEVIERHVERSNNKV